MRTVGPVFVCLSLLFLYACTSSDEPALSPRPGYDREAALAIRPGYKVGIPYEIKGRRYVPVESFSYNETGTASWYGDFFHGRLTANGEVFDMEAMTAAHKTLQLPAIVRVSNLANGRSVIVRINDRGPFVDDRIIDLSKGAAEALGFKRNGLASVRVEVMAEASRRVREIAAARAAVLDMDNMVASLNTGQSDDAPIRLAEAPPALPPTGVWVLQAAAFGDRGNAHRALAQLRQVGPASVVPRAAGARTLYLVRVGPYGDKREAQSVLERVREVGFYDAHLVAPS